VYSEFPIFEVDDTGFKRKDTSVGKIADGIKSQYTAAVKNSTLDSTARAISALNDVYHKDAKLATIMQAPTLSSEDKSAIVAELQKHTGGADKGDTVKNFLDTLAFYNRLGLLKGICEKFGELISASKGEVELTITSASVSRTSMAGVFWPFYSDISPSNWMGKLSPGLSQPFPNLNMLARERNSRSPTRYGPRSLPYVSVRTSLTSSQVNSDILGGLIVEIGDRTIDLSVSARIAKMNKLLTDTL
jgi:F-type H+-transporting ATPase subunit O